MEFSAVLDKIRNLEIQGAENIAISSVDALYNIIHKSSKLHAKGLFSEINKAADQLIKTRPTEPLMKNSMRYILSDLPKKDIVDLVMVLDQRIKSVKNHFLETSDKISMYGSRKIKKGFVVFTHCHSSTVVDLLKFAHHRRVDFEVHNTETRPLFQGRKTAKELSDFGIKVKHYVDSAARIALKKADICLFGADAITSEGNIINKIGTELFIEIADKYEIPIYICADSWKFDPGTVFGEDTPIENRNRDEVWPKGPKRVKIMNPAFELMLPEMVSGIISELGIFHPDVFVEEVKRRYPWIYRSEI